MNVCGFRVWGSRILKPSMAACVYSWFLPFSEGFFPHFPALISEMFSHISAI